ncbi:MAG: hypothetical protein NVS9B4_13860 [Candidatus Acidiferrum sp.]
MPLSAVDSINPAFQHAKQQLAHPFRFVQWVRLAFVGFLAGELGSGGGYNFSYNIPAIHQGQGSEHFLGVAWHAQLTQHPAMVVALIAFLVVVGFGLWLALMYVSSVMRFILFDSVVAKECHVRQGWVRRRHQGRRLVVWQILVMLATFSALIVLVGIPLAAAWAFGWFNRPAEHLLPLILGGGMLFVFFLVLMVGLAVVYVLTKDFVVPQMALEDISAIEGWRRLWACLKAEKGGYAGYIGMKIVLSIGASVALGIISIIVFLVLLIPIGGISAIAVLGGKAAGLTWNFYTIMLAAFVGVGALILLLFALSMICVPAMVFFPAFSIYFFASRYPPLAALVHYQPSVALGWPPQEPPLAPPPAVPVPS